MDKDLRDDELCPQLKRARLLDYAASISGSYSSSFSSSSSASSDEGVAEMSCGPDRPTGSMTTIIPVEAVTMAFAQTVTDARQKPSTALAAAADRETVARRRRRAERDLTECGSSLVDGGDSDSVKCTVDRLSATSCGDGVWNGAKRTSLLDDQRGRSVVVKQVRFIHH